MNVYADIALVFMPVAIVLVAVNIRQDDKRLAQLHQGRPAGLWSFGQFFSLLMVAGSLFEVYKGFMGIWILARAKAVGLTGLACTQGISAGRKNWPRLFPSLPRSSPCSLPGVTGCSLRKSR